MLQVRVDAVVALRSFIDAFDTEGLQQVKPLIPQLLDVFFQLMQEVRLFIDGCCPVDTRHRTHMTIGFNLLPNMQRCIMPTSL